MVFEDEAKKSFYKLDRDIQKRIVTYFEKNVLCLPDPLIIAKLLAGDLAGLWGYRIGDYRVIVTIDQGRFVIVGLAIGHRKDVYSHH